MSIAERYHEPVGRAYRKIVHEMPEVDKVSALRMALKAINDSVGPYGIVPTLLLYGTLPGLKRPSDPHAASTMARAKELKSATERMSKYFASRQYRDALRSRNGPDVTDVHKFPLGSFVRVYRSEIDKWKGPFRLFVVSGETCTLLVPASQRGFSEFRTTVVKQYIPPVPPPAPATPDSLTVNLSGIARFHFQS